MVEPGSEGQERLTTIVGLLRQICRGHESGPWGGKECPVAQHVGKRHWSYSQCSEGEEAVSSLLAEWGGGPRVPKGVLNMQQPGEGSAELARSRPDQKETLLVFLKAVHGPVMGSPPWGSWWGDGRRTFFPLLLWEVVPVAVSGTSVWRRPYGIGGEASSKLLLSLLWPVAVLAVVVLRFA
ncbi:hypothetical protein NDU88_004433 [Pleurodeles waltl]|uniref:Uncharacterized protein n=1 Tax=Pleurodeles waltl TaxID=8319 RepID=A0AAV7MUJ3_PLEWA|nr:hypothetical protein NDU88_004433 [Pleurodeles waltl]